MRVQVGAVSVAFLVFSASKTKNRAHNDYDALGNHGSGVVRDVLNRSGIATGFCSAATAREFRVVLVSLTSVYDVIAFYQAVSLRPEWKCGRRTFVVVAGGAGMMNPVPIGDFIDFAVFGRAEGMIADLVGGILGGNPPELANVMRPPDLHPVQVKQAAGLYPHAVDGIVEASIGCPKRCKFCEYTHSRAHIGGDAYRTSDTRFSSDGEITWDRLTTHEHKRVIVGLDGSSERLRRLFGKGISRADMVDNMTAFASRDAFAKVYNVGNFPTETDTDVAELREDLSKIDARGKLTLVLHTTPFHPTPLTPMQWEGVSLEPNWREHPMRRLQSKRGNVHVIDSQSIESPWTQLTRTIVDRTTPDNVNVFRAMALAPKLQTGKSSERIARLRANFDLSPFLREYDIDEPSPTWFLESYTPNEKIRHMARAMRRNPLYTKGK